MLKGGALVYAIVLSLIVAIISSSLIVFSYIHSYTSASYMLIEKARLNSQSGFTLLLSGNEYLLSKKQIIDLYDTQNDSVELVHQFWGAYEIISSTGFAKDTRINKTAIVGNNANNDTSLALYLANRNTPLAVCGKTSITGDCYLPEGNIKRTYIEGQNFIGNNIVTGKIHTAEKTVPELDKNLALSISNNFPYKNKAEDSLVSVNNTNFPDSANNSFANKTLYLYAKEKIRLSDKLYEGNICIFSEKRIVVSASCSLNDVILIAPIIEIEKDFEGSLQAFASDTLLIGKKVLLHYPSVLGMVNTKSIENKNMYLFIDEEASITGSVFLYDSHPNNQKQLKIIVGNKSQITGELYSNGIIDLKGNVYGSVVCTKFVLKTPSSVYDNQLLNVTINRTKLPKHFVGLLNTANHQQKKVIKWL